MFDFVKKVETGLRQLARFFAALAALALFVIVGIILASVVMRRVADSPLYYTEELVGLLLGASLFLALPMVTQQGTHVRVTFLAHFLSQRGRAVLAVLAAIVTVAFCVWFTIEAIPWLEFAFRRNIKTDAASLRLAPWMAVLPISLTLCALIVIVQVIVGDENTSFHQTRPGD
ncbi:MAG: TRAP transporter small permease [Betaproteobacteria bacterium HGW-Betaproteobacteria-18]|nr:MAG: TRAP transporter small permease [Betaproteobacteria bacterium HGW-Betaproteobacteria-18]